MNKLLFDEFSVSNTTTMHTITYGSYILPSLTRYRYSGMFTRRSVLLFLLRIWISLKL
jgi:hypothetical protein